MKILLISPTLSADYGGPSKCVLELAHELHRNGIITDVVTAVSEKTDHPRDWQIKEETYRIKEFSRFATNKFVFSPSLIWWLFNHAADYDIVHLHTLFSPTILICEWICRLRGIPYIITLHGMLEPWALSHKAAKKKLYFKLFEKRALQKARVVHALTNSEADSVRRLGVKTEIMIVPNGIEKGSFQVLPDTQILFDRFPEIKGKTILLFLGRLNPKKGLDLLASAYALVRQRFPQTHLVLAGPDSDGFLPKVKEYFNKSGCLDFVTFTGMLTGPMKLAALHSASVYVAPSYSEGFSVSILEGMASGLPCVITTGCNFPEAADAMTAYVVEADTIKIADAINECLGDISKAKQMGSRARQFIFKRYTWEKVSHEFIEIYKKIGIVKKRDLSLC